MTRLAWISLLLSIAAAAPKSGLAQRPLSLADALRLAHGTSELMDAARAAETAAGARRSQAASARLPKIAAYSSFDRLLRSEYEGLSLGAPPEGQDVPELPFGSPNTWRAGLTVSHTVFAGGRVVAGVRAADRAGRAAALDVAMARARVTMEVAEAYYDAALAERLVAIGEATLAQAESTFRRAGLVHQAGRGSEFDWLRAKVARDRQRPAVIRQRAERDVAMLRLGQLLHLPAGEPLVLTTTLDLEPAEMAEPLVSVASLEPVEPVEPAMHAVALAAAAAPPAAPAGPGPAERAIVRRAAEDVRRREQLLSAVRASRWPELAVVSSFERVAYARQGLPEHRDFRTNWTVGARIDFPLFTGGDRSAREAEARAELAASRAELRRTERLAGLDLAAQAARLAAAEATWRATEGSVREAERAHEIAALRHREGLAIQLELSDSRLALEEARAERARAARAVLVERLRAALVRDLPVEGGGR